MLASIPSPSDATLNIGPLTMHYYGIVIAIGVALAFTLTRRRYERYGGDGEPLDRVMVWAVLLGFLGARFGYVLTHLDTFFGDDARLAPWKVIAIWEGGLAFFGGVFLATLTAYVMLRRLKLPVLPAFDAAAIAVPVAQAMGRLGNWFNQELFGSPTDLPWALEIDERFRPDGLEQFPTFHPTFLYELVLNLLAVVVIVTLEKRRAWKRGSLFLLYLMLYGVIRFLMELLRTDDQLQFLGIRNNGWISVLVFVVAGVVLWRRETGRGDILGRLVARDEALLAATDEHDEHEPARSVLTPADLEGEALPAPDDAPDAAAPDA